jgi:hypothetical protein
MSSKNKYSETLCWVYNQDGYADKKEPRKKVSPWDWVGFGVLMFFYLSYVIAQGIQFTNNSNAPILSYSYPQTTADDSITLNYSNFAFSVLDLNDSSDLFSQVQISLSVTEPDVVYTQQYSFIPINSSNFMQSSGIYGGPYYTLNDTLELKRQRVVGFYLSTLNCSAYIRICLYAPPNFDFNLTTGEYIDPNPLNYSELCLPLLPQQFVQYSSPYQIQNAIRNYYSSLDWYQYSDSRNQYFLPQFLNFLFSYPLSSCASGQNLLLLELTLVYQVELTTVDYLTVSEFLSSLGGTWTTYNWFCVVALLALWKLVHCRKSFEKYPTGRCICKLCPHSLEDDDENKSPTTAENKV